MKKHEQLMLIAAKSNIPVLLQGESGVGKEIAAIYTSIAHETRAHS